MKCSAILLVAAGVLLCGLVDYRAFAATNYSSLADQLMTYMKSNSMYEEVNVTDIVDKYNWGFIPLSLTLTKGTVWGIQSIERTGDVTMTYNASTRMATVKAGLSFKNVKYQANYKAKASILKDNGNMTVNITKLDTNMTLMANMSNTKKITANLTELSFAEPDSMKVTVNTGNAITSTIQNVVVEYLLKLFHSYAIIIMDETATSVLNDALSKLSFDLS